LSASIIQSTMRFTHFIDKANHLEFQYLISNVNRISKLMISWRILLHSKISMIKIWD